MDEQTEDHISATLKLLSQRSMVCDDAYSLIVILREQNKALIAELEALKNTLSCPFHITGTHFCTACDTHVGS